MYRSICESCKVSLALHESYPVLLCLCLYTYLLRRAIDQFQYFCPPFDKVGKLPKRTFTYCGQVGIETLRKLAAQPVGQKKITFCKHLYTFSYEWSLLLELFKIPHRSSVVQLYQPTPANFMQTEQLDFPLSR